MRDDRCKLKQGKHNLGIRRNFSTLKTAGHWSTLPRKGCGLPARMEKGRGLLKLTQEVSSPCPESQAAMLPCDPCVLRSFSSLSLAVASGATLSTSSWCGWPGPITPAPSAATQHPNFFPCCLLLPV